MAELWLADHMAMLTTLFASDENLRDGEGKNHGSHWIFRQFSSKNRKDQFVCFVAAIINQTTANIHPKIGFELRLEWQPQLTKLLLNGRCGFLFPSQFNLMDFYFNSTTERAIRQNGERFFFLFAHSRDVSLLALFRSVTIRLSRLVGLLFFYGHESYLFARMVA